MRKPLSRHKLNLVEFLRSFFDRVEYSDNCWLWKGKKNESGYGIVYKNDLGNIRAHHVTYVLAFGKIPEGKSILHRCDNRDCVKAEHLFAGTPKENSEDMVAKGRNFRVKGENNSLAKLSDKEVKTMRELFAQGVKQKDLVKMFKTTSSTVTRVVRFQTRREYVSSTA